MSDEIKFEVGEFAEGMPWSIVYDREHEDSSVKPCRHCINISPAPQRKRKDGSVWNDGYIVFTVPRAVEAWNEGGYNGTIVCLDCILEGVHELTE